MNAKLFIAIGLLASVAAIQWWIRSDRRPSPETLADRALSAATPDERQLAAVELAAWGEQAVVELRRVFGESESEAVRMICVARTLCCSTSVG